MNEYRKQVSSLEMELESLRGTNEYLERNLAGEFYISYIIYDSYTMCHKTKFIFIFRCRKTIWDWGEHISRKTLKDKQWAGKGLFQSDFSQPTYASSQLSLNAYCDTVSILKHLKATNDMKKHLIEYKNLMNVKLSLEKEIDVYRSLLEGNFS